MRNCILTAAAIVAMAMVAPRVAQAQDRPHDDHDDPAHHDDHPRPDDHPDDMVARYRHDHPGATAHCHDGFFTKTRDRRLACSKHGGIDVWIAM
jgi:hypothetical protein